MAAQLIVALDYQNRLTEISVLLFYLYFSVIFLPDLLLQLVSGLKISPIGSLGLKLILLFQ